MAESKPFPSSNCTTTSPYFHGENQMNAEVTYELMTEAANFLLNKTKYRPKIGIVCGSGLSAFGDCVENAEIIPYEDIPHFPTSTVPGHRGQMIFGKVNGVTVMCMQGRFHYYEGYSLAKVCMPIRVMNLVGVTHLVATNAAGSLNDNYNVGDIVLLKDHINFLGLSGISPLRGSNESRFGPRFLPANNSYDKVLKTFALDIVDEMNIRKCVHEGVYVCVGGPTYESIAEVRMLRAFGGDCVGMSTVHEVIAARHCGMKVVALSFITNKCITQYENQNEPNHEEVLKAANQHKGKLTQIISQLVFRINADVNRN
ncbi:purine nucleoside phosphorylase-like [Bradysia coprophila]|uniref:purine nucleoside phosphorylase-like n=1 Tax=Bradysia coprophila TaxID=38358 RepID=UPI00187DBD0A|nr:purine nucleoside phosphorylase-like [Bradysia coprophila]XP_037037367.1 purine nucleoside phosphorylase-like [Bradysia coprophila]